MTVTFDIQSVLQIPSSEVSLLYYKRKLNMYNLTIYEGFQPNRGFCLAWTEISGNRGSCEIGSCLLWDITNHFPPHVKHLSLFSDTCGGRNRNIQVASLFLNLVQVTELSIMEQKFLESGHSYMECDSMHSAIE